MYKENEEVWKVDTSEEERSEKKKLEIIIISKGSEGSYAAILRRVEANPEFSHLANNVRRIRRSLKGNFSLEFKDSKDMITDRFLSRIGKPLG